MFDVHITDRVAVVTFARPPANWMSVAALTELLAILGDLAGRTAEASVVMLTGGIDGYFVAHADFDDTAAWARGEQPPGDPDAWRKATDLLERMPQPTVAAIDGQAWGGGCELALACTLRIGSERAHLALPEVSVGVIPGAGGTQRLPRIISPAAAAQIILSGSIIKAAEAHRLGLLNAVLPTDDFLAAAVRWCTRITRHPTTAVLSAKRSIVDGSLLPLDDGLRLEKAIFDEVNQSPEARERNARFVRPS